MELNKLSVLEIQEEINKKAYLNEVEELLNLKPGMKLNNIFLDKETLKNDLKILKKRIDNKLEKADYTSKEKVTTKIIKLICEENLIASFSWRYFSENSNFEIFEEIRNLNKTNIRWKNKENFLNVRKEGLYRISIYGKSKLKDCLKGFKIKITEGKNLNKKKSSDSENDGGKIKLIKKTEHWVFDQNNFYISPDSKIYFDIIESFSKKNIINGCIKIKKLM